MKTVRHDGRETAFRASPRGAGLVVLYVHGSGGTHRVWGRQYGPNGPDYPAVAVDLSGHGESEDVDADPGPRALEAYVADVEAVARETGAEVAVGNSLGGAVVLRAALEERFEPAALVLAGTGAKLAVDPALRTLLREDFAAAVDALHEPDRLFHEPDERVLARSRSEMRAVGRAVTERDFLTCHAFDERERVSAIAQPTLAVCGEHDRLTPPSFHEYLAERVSRGRYESVADAAHLAMIEQPASFNRTLASFLDSLDLD